MNAGKVVIADRYSYTALARDRARGIDQEWVKRIYSLAIEPDIAFLCNVPVEIALKRAMKKNGNVPKYYESGMDVSGETDPVESFVEFQGRVDKAYAELVDNGALHPIRTDCGEDKIFESIIEQIEPLLDKVSLDLGSVQEPELPEYKESWLAKSAGDDIAEVETFIDGLPKHKYPGKLIAMEGASRESVTHQVNALYDWFQIHNVDVVKAGIGETWISSEIMNKAMSKNALSARTNVMLAASEMAYIIETEVVPALERGATVILNRFFLTTLVSGLLSHMGREWLAETLKGFAIKPDLTLYIDTPTDILLEKNDLSNLLAIESLKLDLDDDIPRNIEINYDYYHDEVLSAYRKIVEADALPIIRDSDDRTELYNPIIEAVSGEIGIDPDEKGIDKELKEVLELYHKHNGYFEHAQKVRRFATQLFDVTVDIHGLNSRARRLLEYAALLHDVGRSQGENHEKHSYKIIMKNKFSRIKKREKRIIAIAALYHNGSVSGLNLSRQWKLRAGEQLAVRRLAAILRVADALDSSDRQVIMKLRLSREEKALILDINSVNKAKAERKSVLNKKDLFEQEFGLDVLVDRNRAERMKTKGVKSGRELFL